MILVVLAMLSMLGIVALAIDVITLYSARSETQRAADSAALVAAKMLVDAGVTGDPANAALQGVARTIASTAATDVARQSVIAGRPIQAADVTVTFPNSGAPSFAINPQVSVTVQNANLPTFFSRIWSRAALTVRATATAEGFNPSNSSTIVGGGVGVPVIARCVKPFIIPNCDPTHAGAGCGATGATLFDPGTGAITNPGVAPGGIIGAGFDLISSCGGTAGLCTPGPPDASPGPGGLTLRYYPASIPAATNSCPAACGAGTNFENDIACCNPTPISCGFTATLPAVNQLPVDTTVNPEAGSIPAKSGVQCLIRQTPGNGQDNLISGPPLTYPLQIEVGGNHPLAGTVLSANDLVTTSDSLVTVPVYDGAATPGASVTIIGFLQVFIDRAFPGGGGPKAGEFHVTVVNVSGCGSSATGTAVASSSAVPVRLIHQ